MVKTNVMRVLDKEKIAYEPFSYSPELTEGVKIAEVLGEDPACVFKTLVTESGDREHFVFVIPVAETLDLKAAARAVGAKSVSMLKQKELLPLTGYIHGGCSPVGMKKKFKTVIDESADCVMVPIPGPISSTKSSFVICAASIISSKIPVSIKKFCPNFF